MGKRILSTIPPRASSTYILRAQVAFKTRRQNRFSSSFFFIL